MLVVLFIPLAGCVAQSSQEGRTRDGKRATVCG